MEKSLTRHFYDDIVKKIWDYDRGCVIHKYAAGCVQAQRIAVERGERRRKKEPEAGFLGIW